MLGIPDEDACRRLHLDLGLEPRLVAHMEAVAALGAKAAKALQDRGHMVDVKLVTAGCLLHDIGRSRDHGISHGLMGAKLLAERGYPDALVKCVERHVGGGIDAVEAAKLGLPMRDFNPLTLEEKLVCHIDNLFDGDRRQTLAEEVAYLQRQGLPQVVEKVTKLHAEISRDLGMDLDKFGR